MKNEVRPLRLIDAPVGLLEFDGTVILKTEYMTRRADGSVVPDCYIVESGEYFCGGVETAEELKNLEVTQVSLNSYGEHHFPDLTKMVPLTLSQLREMDGQPVWCKSLINGKSEWAIIRIVEMSKTWFIAIAGASQGFGDKDTYGQTWLVYAYPPAHIDREAWEPCFACCDPNMFYDHFGREGSFGTARYCPNCGRPLHTEEAWAELEERMGLT